MADIYPDQIRTVDPFASYNSNVVNRLTRMITRGENCLFGIHSMDVEIDPSSPLDTVIVTAGECFKDDVIVQLTADHTVLMSDVDFYPFVPSWSEAGYYYIVLDYTYIKAKPAPEASIRIIKPSSRAALTSAYLLLKVVEVIFNGVTFEIASLLDYDPEIPANKRNYVDLYCGVEDSLPDFVQSNDEARLIYVKDVEEFYFGRSSQWESFNSVRDNIDTSGLLVGNLAYFGDDGQLHASLATDETSYTDCIVIDSDANHGKVRLVGRCTGVQIETGVTLSVGDRLYTSSTDAGTVTNVVGGNFIGKCLALDATGTCEIWFIPGAGTSSAIGDILARLADLEARVTALEGRMTGAEGDISSIDGRVTNLENEIGNTTMIRTRITPGMWLGPSSGYYYYDIDIAALAQDWVVVTCWDETTGRIITPADVATLGTLDVRILMPVNTVTMRVVIAG